MNVISSTKIQELPDATVAEAVGRLPGISVLRTGGEGNEVVIRGLAPKFNKIQIDGVDLSSSNPNDRSTDMSMISSNMLEGIQVSKSVTADMDADVVGGTVNFQLREAKIRESTSPLVNFLIQGAYNGLSDAYNKTNNYKYVISAENRYFDNLFGVFAQVDVERKNLTSNEFGATYGPHTKDVTLYELQSFNLNDIPRDRMRYNGALVLDYKIPDGKLKLTNFLSSGNTDVQNRQETYLINNGLATNQHQYQLAFTSSQLSQISNTFEYDQQIPVFHVNAKLSHTYSETKDPNDWTVSFIQNSAGLQSFIGATNLNPINIPKSATNDLSKTFLNTIVTSSSFSKQRALTASLDLDANTNFSDFISANFKFGGKYRYQTRSYDYDTYDGQGLFEGSAKTEDDMISSYFHLPSTLGTSIPMGYFVDNGFSYGKFLGGDYTMISPLNYGMMSAAAALLKKNADQNGGTVAFGKDNYLSTTSDYDGNEKLSAFYVMSVVNIGPDITVIPGVRYQNLQTTYTSSRGIQSSLAYQIYNHYDTTITQSHGFWLPDVAVRYKPTPWCDIRLSYTNTVAYPDYGAIIPTIDVGFSSISYHNPELIPSRSHNYDAYVSFYENTVGLFTIGGFLKQIDNLIYPYTFNVLGTAALPYYPPGLAASSPKGTYTIQTFVNDSYKINDYGMELDWQTHFWYLPGPLSGLVFNVNYTHIFSKAEYPYVFSSQPSRFSPAVNIDTSFVDKLLYQPNDIINLSLGFDYAGFSARISMLSQTQIFTGPNFWPQLRPSTSTYTRWDLALKQELPWFGIQVYGDVNNINGAHDISVLPIGSVPQSQQDYGMTADLGVRLKF
jgi:TonB-dependent receptor